MRKIYSLLLLGMIVSQPTFTQNNWTQQNPPAPKPLFRSSHAMATIINGHVLLFGGFEGSIKNDTWLYSLADDTWKDLNPSTKPSVRSAHVMAAINEKEVLMFGGVDINGGSKETWLFNIGDNSWRLMEPENSPPALAFAGMAYAGNDNIILFGGSNSNGKSNDTWLYDLSENSWKLMEPPVKPTKRNRLAMAYLEDDKVLLFGGQDSAGNNTNDTWVFDVSDNTWTAKNPFNKPSARNFHAMADIEGDRALLFGGTTVSNSTQPSNETWVYDLSNNKWTLRTPVTKPSARSNHSMASTAEGKVVLFGGNTIVDENGLNGETWVFDPGKPVTITCPGNINKSASSTQCGATVSFAATATGIPAPTISYKAEGVITSPHTFPLGTTTVTCTATNSIGDVATCSFTITVKDTKKPVFNCPGDTTLQATGPDGAKFTYNDPVATDNCSAIVFRIAGPASNATFPVGATTVVFVAKDPSANTDTCRFTVTVLDQGGIANPSGEEMIDNYPNPFIKTTTIQYKLDSDAQVELSVYNSIGQKVKQLVNGNVKAGVHYVKLDAEKLPGGIYIYRLQVNSKDKKPIVVVKKLMLQKN